MNRRGLVGEAEVEHLVLFLSQVPARRARLPDAHIRNAPWGESDIKIRAKVLAKLTVTISSEQFDRIQDSIGGWCSQETCQLRSPPGTNGLLPRFP